MVAKLSDVQLASQNTWVKEIDKITAEILEKEQTVWYSVVRNGRRILMSLSTYQRLRKNWGLALKKDWVNFYDFDKLSDEELQELTERNQTGNAPAETEKASKATLAEAKRVPELEAELEKAKAELEALRAKKTNAWPIKATTSPELEALKEKAKGLGITFNQNIWLKKLQIKVNEFEAEKAEANKAVAPEAPVAPLGE